MEAELSTMQRDELAEILRVVSLWRLCRRISCFGKVLRGVPTTSAMAYVPSKWRSLLGFDCVVWRGNWKAIDD